ncbi:hypothetical protein, variant 1 [Aphanomyces invadans]|uniref:Anoctamin transmembrane domain-containing protein n=1 Tax=Aphanomyces invadans TaxID=157072 RepID=A0A024TSX7_9STRA|nr:hypothetical protein, variant 1 [Aphanomyces invadans]ETV97119.1 hypothetical protein, variant 1 [Aphanomyces invadans]|eukprot:XP_008874365.1 hypothetical protein, variant 1 [Aphanomyces invadans]
MHEICVQAQVHVAADDPSHVPEHQVERLATFAHVMKDKGLDVELIRVGNDKTTTLTHTYLLLLGISAASVEEKIAASLPDEYKFVHTLPGSARTQQVILATLREATVDDNLYLGDENLELAFHAQEKLFPQLQAHLKVSLFPLHNEDARHHLIKKWHAAPLYAIPFESIHSYFGPELSMYFIWLDFYTRFLVIPSACGAALFAMEYCGIATSVYVWPYTILFAISTSIFVDAWKKTQRATEFTWQYMPIDDTYSEPRAAFVGEWMQDSITGELVFDTPHWKRMTTRLCVTLPLVLLMCSFVLLYVLGLELFYDHNRHWFPMCYDRQDENDTTMCGWILQGPSVLNAILIEVMDMLYLRLARWLTNLENYRTAAEFENQLIIKRMPFHFININASLLYLAFVAQDMERLRRRLWILMVGMQCLDNVKEVAMPYLMVWLHGGLHSGHANDHVHSTKEERVEHILLQKQQSRYADTFSDFKEMMIQYGYVTLYAPVFPLAPLFALLNNVIEARSDLFKLVNVYGMQRPYAKHVHGIGVWERVLFMISIVAVLVNCGLLGVYELPKLAPTLSDVYKCCLVVLLEHVVLLIKLCVNWSNKEASLWTAADHRRKYFDLQSIHMKQALQKAA